MSWFFTKEYFKVYIIMFINTTKTLFINMARLHSLSFEMMCYWLCILPCYYSHCLNHCQWFVVSTLQWKLYHSTHCGWKYLVGTWNVYHCAMHILKAHDATLVLILVEGFWSLLWLVHCGHEGSFVSPPVPCLCNEKYCHPL